MSYSSERSSLYSASSACSSEIHLEDGLRVGIIGAGLAGLCTAIALRRAGHICEVFERSRFKNETGAAVSIPPNGSRILHRWGFDADKSRGVQNLQVRRPRGGDLEPIAPTIDFRDVHKQHGANWDLYHRADFHKQLHQMATSDDQPGVPGVIHLGAQVVDIYPEAGIIAFKNGNYTQKDLIIIADGQYDQLHTKVTGAQIPLEYTSQSVICCLVPMESVLSDTRTAPIFQNKSPGFWIPSCPQKGVSCVTYPCRDNQMLNCLVIHRSQESDKARQRDSWNSPATRAQLSTVLPDFHPSVQAIVAKATEVKEYPQIKRRPLSNLFKGKVVLVGDAAHPMQHTHVQGIATLIEDAAALEVLLSSLPTTSSPTEPASAILTERLNLYERLRLPRVSATQILSDPIAPGPNAGLAHDMQLFEIRKYYKGPLPLNMSPFNPDICEWFFGYDVTEEAFRVLEASERNDLSHVLKTYDSRYVLSEKPFTAQQSPSVSPSSSPVRKASPEGLMRIASAEKRASFFHDDDDDDDDYEPDTSSEDRSESSHYGVPYETYCITPESPSSQTSSNVASPRSPRMSSYNWAATASKLKTLSWQSRTGKWGLQEANTSRSPSSSPPSPPARSPLRTAAVVPQKPPHYRTGSSSTTSSMASTTSSAAHSAGTGRTSLSASSELPPPSPQSPTSLKSFVAGFKRALTIPTSTHSSGLSLSILKKEKAPVKIVRIDTPPEFSYMS